MKRKEKLQELKEFLLKNFTDEFGDLDISGLDFSDFDGNVNIDIGNVKGVAKEREKIEYVVRVSLNKTQDITLWEYSEEEAKDEAIYIFNQENHDCETKIISVNEKEKE